MRFVPVFDPGGSVAASLVELVFDTAVTAGFIAACRRSGIAVHAALGAAHLLAVIGAFPDGAAHRLGLTSTVDLRKKMVPRVSDGTPGVYFSMIRTAHYIGLEQDFYALAKDLQEQISKSIERGHAHLAWLGLGQIARLGLKGFGMLSNRIPSSTTFSHLGHTSARLPDSDFRIMAVSGTVCPTPLTPMVTMTNLFDGRLFANIRYDSSNLSDERALKLAERFQSIIQGIAHNERLST